MSNKRLVFFRYEEHGWPYPPRSISFRRESDRVVRTEETIWSKTELNVGFEEIEALETLLETLNAIKWKRVYRLPDNMHICDGGSWTLEFVYEDGVRHRRRGGTYAEPDNFDRFYDYMERIGFSEIYWISRTNRGV